MILKASQRAGGQNLAAHLMRTDENEHVELHEVRGFIAEDLHGAFKEAYAISRATKCQQYLFSLSLNPPESENVAVATFEKAIDQIERELGLKNQPRAIVFHEKQGRRHAHVVWSRIDAATMTAKQMSFFKRRLQSISRDLFIENDWKMPRGLVNKAERNPLNFTLTEWQQAKRSGADPRDIKRILQNCWAVSDSLTSFTHALQDQGFWLARGDRRGFVAIDYSGEVYSLARALGRKAKEVRERLGDEQALNSVAITKQEIAEKMTPAIKTHIQTARDQFKQRSIALDHKRQVMTKIHQSERATLKAEHQQRQANEAKARAERLPKGLKALWARVTGQHKKLKQRLVHDVRRTAQLDREEKQFLITRHLKERRPLQQHLKTARKAQAVLLQELRADVRRYIELGRIDDPPTPIPERQQTQTRQKRRRTRQQRLSP